MRSSSTSKSPAPASIWSATRDCVSEAHFESGSISNRSSSSFCCDCSCASQASAGWSTCPTCPCWCTTGKVVEYLNLPSTCP